MATKKNADGSYTVDLSEPEWLDGESRWRLETVAVQDPAVKTVEVVALPFVPQWTPGASYVVGSAYMVGGHVLVCTERGIVDAGPAAETVKLPE